MPRPRRPASAYEPGTLATLNLHVPVPFRLRLEDHADETGRSLLSETSHLVTWALDHQHRLGGPSVCSLLESMATSAIALCGQDWIRDPNRFFQVADLWRELMLAAKPQASASAWLLASAQRAIDAFTQHPDSTPVAVARQFFDESCACANTPDPEAAARGECGYRIAMAEATIAMAEIETDLAAGEITTEAARDRMKLVRQKISAAIKARRAPWSLSPEKDAAHPVAETAAPEITVDQQIGAGRRLVAEMQTTTDSDRYEHLCDLLRYMSRIAAFPEDIRQEFATAAAAEPPAVTAAPAPAPSAPPGDEWRPPPVHLFEAGWLLVEADARNRFATPAPEQIAEIFEREPDLIRLAGMRGPQSAKTILRYRAWVDAEKARVIADNRALRRKRGAASDRPA